jgi:hypothetical protein
LIVVIGRGLGVNTVLPRRPSHVMLMFFCVGWLWGCGGADRSVGQQKRLTKKNRRRARPLLLHFPSQRRPPRTPTPEKRGSL